jgi:hypothetical protein
MGDNLGIPVIKSFPRVGAVASRRSLDAKGRTAKSGSSRPALQRVFVEGPAERAAEQPGDEEGQFAGRRKLPANWPFELTRIRSCVLRFVAGCALVENLDEVTAGLRHAGMFATDNLTSLHGVAIYVCAGFIVGANGRAFE